MAYIHQSAAATQMSYAKNPEYEFEFMTFSDQARNSENLYNDCMNEI